MDEEIQQQLAAMQVRIAELEERVAALENRGSSAPRPVSSGSAIPASAGSGELIEALRAALSEMGEGDAGAMRQQLVKNPQWAALTRSDVNKALYANENSAFVIVRKEGAKPVWKLLA